MKKRIDLETVKQEYIINGLSRKEIATKYRVTISCINSIIRRNNIPTKEIKPPKIFIGAKFGFLEVKDLFVKESSNQNRKFAICLCKCGNTKDIPAYNLQVGITKTCGCEKSPIGEKSKKWRGYGQISAHAWRILVNRAERSYSHLEFDIDIEYIWELYIKQNKKCALSNLDITFDNKNKKLTTASIDRIDSTKGYIKGNVQWIHKHINRMKLNFKEEYFLAFCNIIAKNNPITQFEIDNIIKIGNSGLC